MIRERSRLVSKLLETRQHSAELERQLGEERDRIQSVTAELDRQVAECEQLCSRLSCAESLNRSLQEELTQLQSIPTTTTAVIAGLSRPMQSPLFAVPTTPASDHQFRHVSHPDLLDSLQCILLMNFAVLLCAYTAASKACFPRVGPGYPLPPLLLPCPFTSSSFALYYFFPFSFSHSLYLFSAIVHLIPFYQNSPTPFPGERS